MSPHVSLAPDAPQSQGKSLDALVKHQKGEEIDYNLQDKIIKLILRCEEFKCISQKYSLSSETDAEEIQIEHREPISNNNITIMKTMMG